VTGSGRIGWERHERTFFAVLPFALLAVCTAVSVALKWDSAGELLVDLALVAAAAVWVTWMVTLHPEWTARPRRMGLFLTVLIGLSAALVIRAPWFGFFAFSALFYVENLVGRWRWVAFVALATLLATSQNGGVPDTEASALAIWATLVAVNIGVGGLLMQYSLHREEQRKERQERIDELTELNRKLEAALRENAGLQAQLVTQAREAGMLDERQRLAREIHDTLAQGLTGIVTQLEAATNASAHSDAWRAHLDAAVRLARDSLSEARRSVHDLRPEELEAARLPDALAEVARKWSELNGVGVEVKTTGNVRPLRPEVEIALLRTAQEALANVAKHAQATRVGVTLSYMEDVLALDVRDDGVGFDASTSGNGSRTREAGFGLAVMHERLEQLAGTLEIESEPGRGTAVSASVPAVPVQVDA
jgi:signal transduction histidine kinase